MYVSLKDGDLEFRFSGKQYLPFESCPITNDPVQVDIISKTVLWYFNRYDIRQRLKDGPVISPCMDDHPEAISQYLRDGNTDQFAKLLNDEYATCVFYEWDEIDLDYVLVAINDPLPHGFVEGDIEIMGDAQLIKLQFGTKQKIVSTNRLFQHSDLDALIQTAAELLDPHFEIRWFIDVHGIVNNMCFVVLRPEAWEELESTFGEERIKREFQPITQSIFPFQQREAFLRMNN